MITSFTPLFFLQFLLFCVALIFSWWIPGNLFVEKLSLSTFPRIILSFVVGMVLFVWQAVVFGWLQTEWLSYVYLLITTVCWLILYSKKKRITNFWRGRFVFDPIIFGIISIGVIVQLLSVWFVGVATSQGMLICCGHSPDNLLELSVVYTATKGFPPEEPGLAGIPMYNYHYWSHIAIAKVITLFHLPLIATTYQYMSIILSLFLGLTALAFCNIINAKKTFSRWLLFFLYFGSDAIIPILFFLRGSIITSLGGLEMGTGFLNNYPRAFSIIVLFGLICIITLWIKKKQFATAFLIPLFVSILLGFKVYVGIFVLVGIGMLFIYYAIKKDLTRLIPLGVTFLLSAVVYLPVNTSAGGLFFSGTWRFENFIVQPELQLSHLELARQIYAAHNNVPRIVFQEVLFGLIYIIAMFGTKLIGLYQTRKTLGIFPKELHIFLLSGITVCFISGLFFLQTTGGANTFNFLVVVFIVSSLYAAITCTFLLEKYRGVLAFGILMAILVFTLPRTIAFTQHTIKTLSSQNIQINKDEISALAYLRTRTPANALIYTDQSLSGIQSEPYVGFLSERSVFLAHRSWVELGINGILYENRKQSSNIIEKSKNALQAKKTLQKERINFLYMLTSTDFIARAEAIGLQKVFGNKVITIWQVIN